MAGIKTSSITSSKLTTQEKSWISSADDDYLLAAELYEVAVKIRRHDGIVQTVLLLC